MLIQDQRYGNTNTISIVAFRYADNNNICLRGHDSATGEPWCTYTVNMGVPLPDDRVALKIWSENFGTAQVLISADVIEPESCGLIEGEGFVDAPVYMLTPRAIAELKIAELSK